MIPFKDLIKKFNIPTDKYLDKLSDVLVDDLFLEGQLIKINKVHKNELIDYSIKIDNGNSIDIILLDEYTRIIVWGDKNALEGHAGKVYYANGLRALIS